jgi:hypothetical protein
MSDQTPTPPRYNGAATLVRYAIYVHRGIIPREDVREAFPGGSLLLTSSAERAISEGLPPASHRPAINSLLTGAPSRPWNPDTAVERLRGQLRAGGAVCIRLTQALDPIELTVGWREKVGLAFPMGETEDRVTELTVRETRVLAGLSLSIPANQSPEFALFDRTTLAQLPIDDRPLSIVNISGLSATAWAAGSEGSLDTERFRHLVGGGIDRVANMGLVHSALDHKVDPLSGFLAAWAALERSVNGSFRDHLAQIEAAPSGDFPPLVLKVLQRRQAEDYRPSITDNFLLTCFGLGSRDLEGDERAFKQVNRLRQAIYHQGDLTDLARARDEALQVLLRLLRLQTAGSEGPHSAKLPCLGVDPDEGGSVLDGSHADSP